MFTVKFIPLKINKFKHYSKIIMCNLKLSWMILDLLLQNNLSTMEYIRIIQKVSKYHTNDQHWSRKIPYPTIYWRLPLFNKCLNTSYDFSQRVSITNYFPKIICKLFNFGWLSIFKILNKQTKWGEKSISLACGESSRQPMRCLNSLKKGQLDVEIGSFQRRCPRNKQ